MKCIHPEPKPAKFKLGDRVLVRDSIDQKWKRRYFAYQVNGRYWAFDGDTDEWSSHDPVCAWQYCIPWAEGCEE